METERLKQFKTIVDAGGLLKAGEILGISGGGLSKSMRTLERDVGFALFVQKGRGLELTEQGRRLYERIPQVLKSVDDLLRFRPVTTASEPIRLVSFEVFTTYFIGSIAGQFGPDRPMEVREAVPGDMEKLVAEGKSDIGVTYMPVPYAGVEFLKVGRIRMGIFAQKERWRKTAVQEVPFAVPVPPLHGTPSGVQGLDGWPEHLFPRRILFRVEMMETALQLCRRGLAAAFLPEFVIDFVNQQCAGEFRLDEVPLPQGIKPVYRDVFLILRQNFEETKTVRGLAKALRALQ